MSVRPHRLLPIAALALGLMLGGCFTQNYQRGYILADGALEQTPLGAPQEHVLITLGTPSTVAGPLAELQMGRCARHFFRGGSDARSGYCRGWLVPQAR